MDYIEANKWYITASKLKLFMDSPLLYKAVYVDEVDLSNIKKSPALEIWSMVDKFVLTPIKFDEEYAFQKASLKADLIAYCENNWIALTWKEKVEELKELVYWNKKVLTEAQEAIVTWIAEELVRQPLWDVEWSYEKQKELFWEYDSLKIKWTLDRFNWNEPNKKAVIRDLKTTSQMYYNSYYDNTQFYSDLSTKDSYHYKLQMALYVWLVKQNYPDVKDITVIIDAVWTNDPYFYQAIKLDIQELEDMRETTIIPLLNSIKLMNSWLLPVNENRNKLASNRYYKLGTDDCIQKDFEYIWPKKDMIEVPKPDEMFEWFDRDNL